MLDRNMVLVLRTRQERTERRLRHKKGANPPPMEPPAQLLNNNHLYLDLNINLSENCKQESNKATKKVGNFCNAYTHFFFPLSWIVHCCIQNDASWYYFSRKCCPHLPDDIHIFLTQVDIQCMYVLERMHWWICTYVSLREEILNEERERARN